ncbi:hypothetical protein GCM10011583_11940 [Streptomyces camponoticapitis]|uniref:Scaffolding protein n=1 Tax=Streptomyces camponoticapitis TaxID=1616125 RepID=A0ABQ2DZH2_9ACTN|nr:hypothetical protein [Streptomyces camponoticapitis]GGJ82018.1 hypothetical protein GCM10011583_11940 [Streptomyces camponoticapitis]
MQKRTLARHTGRTGGWAHPYRTGPFDPYLYADGGDGDDSDSTDDGADGDADADGQDDAAGSGDDNQDDADKGAKEDKPKPKAPAQKDGGKDLAAENARLAKELKAANSESAKARVEAKDQAAKEARDSLAKDLANFLDPKRDEKADPPDPEKLMAQISEERTAHRGTAIELAVFKGSSKHGADPELLADSKSFMTKLGKLDPASDDFSKKVGEAIKAAVADNPRLKAGNQAPARSSGDFNGATKDTGADPEDIDEIRKERRKRRSG